MECARDSLWLSVITGACYSGNVWQLLGDMQGGKASLQRAMALGNVACRKRWPEVAATMQPLERALEGGAVVSHAVH